MTGRLWVGLVVVLGSACADAPCTTAGGVVNGKDLAAECCEGLEHDSLNLQPGEGYEGDDLPDGCTRTGEPFDFLVCIECGDGDCGPGENHCNCEADCPRE